MLIMFSEFIGADLEWPPPDLSARCAVSQPWAEHSFEQSIIAVFYLTRQEMATFYRVSHGSIPCHIVLQYILVC